MRKIPKPSVSEMDIQQCEYRMKVFENMIQGEYSDPRERKMGNRENCITRNFVLSTVIVINSSGRSCIQNGRH